MSTTSTKLASLATTTTAKFVSFLGYYWLASMTLAPFNHVVDTGEKPNILNISEYSKIILKTDIEAREETYPLQSSSVGKSRVIVPFSVTIKHAAKYI
jgi:hypothetical protein